jgi:hypothetical protein
MTTDIAAINAPELARLQAWMQMAITAQISDFRTQISDFRSQVSDFRAQISDTGLSERCAPESVEAIVTPSARLSGAERLAIYWRSYHARLLECFETIFPALHQALGNDLFRHFAADYLRHHPPMSYSIDRLADNFPQHLATTRPDADLAAGERERWPDFIVELATLELATLKVFDGPGIELSNTPGAPEVAAIQLEEIGGVRIVPSPALRLFHFQYPVHEYLHACRRQTAPELPAPRECRVALARKKYRMRMHDLSVAQYTLLKQLDSAATLDEATTRAAAAMGAGEFPPATVRDWLGEWVAWGFVEKILYSKIHVPS